MSPFPAIAHVDIRLAGSPFGGMYGDQKTLAYYGDAAEAYAGRLPSPNLIRRRDRFISMLAPGSSVIDLGCGGGHDSLAFKEAGLRVTALDASPELARIASDRIGQDVLVQPMETLDVHAEFDAAWASASLLHLAPGSLPNALSRVADSLISHGLFAASFKARETAWRDRFGRYFCPMSEEALDRLLRDTGFDPIDVSSHAGLGSDGEPTDWIWATARKTRF